MKIKPYTDYAGITDVIKKETRWNRLVRKWALNYIWDLTDEEFSEFMKAVTIRRQLPMREFSKRRPLPEAGLDKIKFFTIQ